MSTRVPRLLPLPTRDRYSRHEHRVRRFSTDYELLRRLRSVATDPQGAAAMIAHVCDRYDVPEPAVTFHGRRGSHTGYCVAPAWHVRLTVGQPAVERWEIRKGRLWPEEGMIRLGKRPSLGTIAHETGHHLIHQRENPGVPAHGRLWVAWFDRAAAAMADWCRPATLDVSESAGP